MNRLNDNIYLTSLMCSISECVAYVSVIPLLKCKRRLIFPLSILFSGISALLFATTNDSTYCIIIAMSVKFFISTAFGIMFIYTTELYPLVVKSLGTGFTNFFGKFGCAMAPIINLTADNMGIHPLIIYGGLCLICSLLCLNLSETLNQIDLSDIHEEHIIK